MKNDDNTVDTTEDQQELSTLEDMRSETDPNGNGTEVGKPESHPSDITYHMIGIITIIFGIIVGIWMLAEFYNQQTLFSASKSELTFGEVVIAFGAAMIFIVPGIICIGIGKIFDLLNK